MTKHCIQFTIFHIFLALLSHQKARMDKLLEDMKSAEDRVGDLKSEVTKLESNVIERKRKRTSTFPSVSISFCLCMFIYTYGG